MLLQTKWSAVLAAVLSPANLDGNLLEDVELVAGNNVINHKLGRKLRGWRIEDLDAAVAPIYRSAPKNDVTLTLNAADVCVVNIWVY